MTLSEKLVAKLACPKCKGELDYRPDESRFVCHNCRLSYPIRDDIPIMLIDEATPL